MFSWFSKRFKSTKASTVPDVLASPTVDSDLYYLLEAASENIKTIVWTYIFELQSGHWYNAGQGQG